ncbi:MAG TPA: folate-binding protein, partial [Stellaceae bacterium]|nr:folate-binding protein [Stellaceae bacterium]
MAQRVYAELPGRGLLEVAGEDRVAFLQGLVSNDVTKAGATRTVFAALLTAQGRYLFDFFVFALDDALYLEAEAARLPELQRRLSLYKLRSKVTLADASPRLAVAAAFGQDAPAALGLAGEGAANEFAGGIAFIDPRLEALGLRFALPRENGFAALEAAGFARGDDALYDAHRLVLGIPDGSRDLPPEKALLLESGFDEMNGIDWQKGCYMGQELTARMKYRALVKKRLLPVRIDGALPPPGTPVLLGSDEAGELRSGRDGRALALLRLDAVEAAAKGTPLVAGGARVTPEKPSW